MNNLHRELAPISDAAWAQIEEEATRTLKEHLAGRRVVDVEGPGGTMLSAIGTGHLHAIAAPGDGIIARFPTPQPEVLAKGVPIVDLYGTLNDTELPHVAGDNHAIGRLVFDHFWERGIRSFAFYAWANRLSRYDEERQEVFRELALSAGCRRAIARRTVSCHAPVCRTSFDTFGR